MKKPKLLLIITPIAIVFMAGIIFLALWIAQGRPDYKGAANYISEILRYENTITEYANSSTGFSFDAIDRDLVGSFQNATPQISSYYESLGASNVQTDKEVAEHYTNLKPFIAKLSEISASQALLIAYVDKVNQSGYSSAANELSNLRGSANTLISKLGGEMADYYADVAAFNKKYENGKTSNYNAMIEEYGIIVLAGRQLSEKYADTTFEEVFNISPDAIAGYFTELRDLESYMRAKI